MKVVMYSNPEEDYNDSDDGNDVDDDDDDSMPVSGDDSMEDSDPYNDSDCSDIDAYNSDNSDFLGGKGQKRSVYGNGKGKAKKKSKEKQTLQIWRREEAVGITEYLGTHEGFFAIIKQRYKDFQVNEINVHGEVIHYTNDFIPDPPHQRKNEPIVTEGTPACVPEDKILEIDYMFDIHSTTAESERKDSKKILEVMIKVDGLGKQDRFSIHSFIKNRYKKVITSTKDIKGVKYIQVRRGITDDRWNSKITWPETQRYTHFVLYKENMDTIEAINKVASMIKVKPPKFCCLAYKDKRCVSSQLVSVPEVDPRRLYNVTKDNWAIKLGNFRYQNEPLKLGQLSGNRYRIVLRKINSSDDVVNKAVESLKCHGFINYYGMHRFGTSNVSNYHIGKLLLQGKWEEVVNFILTPSSINFHGENYFMNMALQEYTKNGNVEEALKQLGDCHKGNSLEAKILKGISECGKNYLAGALSKIPRNLIVQYLHAYQSFIWNSIASRRIKKFGVTVLPGDLVWRLPSASNKETFFQVINETIDAEDSTSVAEENQEEGEDNNNIMNNKNVYIHILTAEEATNTDISQILLPLPGYDSLLPQNEVKDWYAEMLANDGLTLEKLQNSVKAYSARGVYRFLLVHPTDINHCITYYNDVSKPLVQSDKEKLKGEDVEKNKLKGLPGLAEGKKPKPLEPMDIDDFAGASKSNQSTDQLEKNKESDDEDNAMEEGTEGISGTSGTGAFSFGIMGRYGAYEQPRFDMTKGKMKALILEMTLPAYTYASMALRELLKFDTSTQYQNILDPSRANMELGRGNSSFGGFRGRRAKRRRRI